MSVAVIHLIHPLVTQRWYIHPLMVYYQNFPLQDCKTVQKIWLENVLDMIEQWGDMPCVHINLSHTKACNFSSKYSAYLKNDYEYASTW